MIIKNISFFLLFSFIGNALAGDSVVPRNNAEPFSPSDSNDLSEEKKCYEVTFKREELFPHLTVISGPKLAGKTTAVIAKSNESLQREEKIVIFRPSLNSDNNENFICFGDQAKGQIRFIPVGREGEMLSCLSWDTDLIAIDDVQLFSPHIVSVVKKILSMGFEVFIAGYDFDYRLEPFGSTLELARLAGLVFELKAQCSQCGQLACFTRRIVDDSGDQIGTGKNEKFEPCCEECYGIVDCMR